MTWPMLLRSLFAAATVKIHATEQVATFLRVLSLPQARQYRAKMRES